MIIRKSLTEYVDTILNIFDTARQFMLSTGKPTQWNANYPALEDLEPDIQNGNSYVCLEIDKVVATFTLIIGDEPNYQLIENGSWRSETPYGTVHRPQLDGLVNAHQRRHSRQIEKNKSHRITPKSFSIKNGAPRVRERRPFQNSSVFTRKVYASTTLAQRAHRVG